MISPIVKIVPSSDPYTLAYTVFMSPVLNSLVFSAMVASGIPANLLYQALVSETKILNATVTQASASTDNNVSKISKVRIKESLRKIISSENLLITIDIACSRV